jgi:hypothetical protein
MKPLPWKTKNRGNLKVLAKQVIRKPGIYQERWREGWVEARDTGKVRWKHV